MRQALLLIITFVCAGVTSRVHALGDSAVHLTITPQLCIVDTIDDGSNQTMQTTSPDCQTVLPDVAREKIQRVPPASVASPFAGQTNTVFLLQSTGSSQSAPVPRAPKKSQDRKRSSLGERRGGVRQLAVAAFGVLAAALIFATVRARWPRR